MKTIFIVTFVDLVNVGYNPSNVEVFTSEKEANDYVKAEYLKKCEKQGIDEPYAEDTFDYQLGKGFAYIFGSYYWDVFKKELNGEK